MKTMQCFILLLTGVLLVQIPATAQLNTGQSKTSSKTKKTVPAPVISAKKLYNIPRTDTKQENLFSRMLLKDAIDSRLLEVDTKDLTRDKKRSWTVTPSRPVNSMIRFKYYGWSGDEELFTVMPLRYPGADSYQLFPASISVNAQTGKEYRVKFTVKTSERGKLFIGFTPANTYYHEVKQVSASGNGTTDINFIFQPDNVGTVVIYISSLMVSIIGSGSNNISELTPRALDVIAVTVDEL